MCCITSPAQDGGWRRSLTASPLGSPPAGAASASKAYSPRLCFCRNRPLSFSWESSMFGNVRCPTFLELDKFFDNLRMASDYRKRQTCGLWSEIAARRERRRRRETVRERERERDEGGIQQKVRSRCLLGAEVHTSPPPRQVGPPRPEDEGEEDPPSYLRRTCECRHSGSGRRPEGRPAQVPLSRGAKEAGARFAQT